MRALFDHVVRSVMIVETTAVFNLEVGLSCGKIDKVEIPYAVVVGCDESLGSVNFDLNRPDFLCLGGVNLEHNGFIFLEYIVI